MTRVILDEQDADTLLRILYNGTRPPRVHTLICLCGAIADLRISAHAWDGWQVLPHAKCPLCLALASATGFEVPYPEMARERFMGMLNHIFGED
jgi:hypothetical protein